LKKLFERGNRMSGSDCQNVEITIAILNEYSSVWLNPHVERFQNEYPHIKVKLGEFLSFMKSKESFIMNWSQRLYRFIIYLVINNKTTHMEFVQDILSDHAEYGERFGFDGYEAFAGFIGDYAQGNAAVDLTQRIRTDNEVFQQWTNVLPYYRQSNGVFDNKIFMLPVSAYVIYSLYPIN